MKVEMIVNNKWFKWCREVSRLFFFFVYGLYFDIVDIK